MTAAFFIVGADLSANRTGTVPGPFADKSAPIQIRSHRGCRRIGHAADDTAALSFFRASLRKAGVIYLAPKGHLPVRIQPGV